MNHLGLFEGIGGFSLAARWMGWETLAWCEWNEFGQKVLRHHFPEAEGFSDITKTDFTKYANRIDILTGGFPCQPYSLAGKRKGKEDERHLWPEMLRAIREVQPRWVVGENVGGLINWNEGMVFDEVQTDLEAAGYEVWAYVLPACAVNAPHRRDRVWFIAFKDTGRNGCGNGEHDKQGDFGNIGQLSTGSKERIFIGEDLQDDPHPNSNGQHGSYSQHEINTGEGGEYAQRNIEQMGGDAANREGKSSRGELQQRQTEREFGGCNSKQDVANTNGIGLRGQSNRTGESGFIGENESGNYWQNFPTQPPIRFGDDGLSTRLDGITFPKWRNESIKAAGNAIVPQVALQIFKAIQQMEDV
jgi:DNA (cytosine-5)-methyltransferase 1